MVKIVKPDFLNLMLYGANISGRSLGEGRFDKEPQNKYGKKFYVDDMRRFRDWNATAMKMVQEALDLEVANESYSTIQHLSGYQIVKGEIKARELIDFAEHNIKGAEGRIQLWACNHGTLRFYRNMMFLSAKKEQKGSLIETLNSSGIVTINPANCYWHED